MLQEHSLFRKSVIQRRADRLLGNVNIATPVRWQFIGVLFGCATVSTVCFLAAAEYARFEMVPGVVSLDKGVASVVPSRSGVIERVTVSDGQFVNAGKALLRVRSEEDMAGGKTAPAQIQASLEIQDHRLAKRGQLLSMASDADTARFRQQISGLSLELKSLSAQIANQRQLVDVAERDFDSAQKIATSGFISRRDMDSRQVTLISRRQQLAQLDQLYTSKVAAIAEAKEAIAQSIASIRAQIETGQVDRAAIIQQRIQADLARGYTLNAPISGTITALTAREGQPVSTQQQLMAILPRGSKRQIELYVPTSAIGFLGRGQTVRLAIDAFPYQQFGTIEAYVDQISTTTVPRQTSNGVIATYLVTARLNRSSISAFGHRRPLIPGMTLTARIITDRRSLLEWIFEPIFSVRNR